MVDLNIKDAPMKYIKAKIQIQSILMPYPCSPFYADIKFDNSAKVLSLVENLFVKKNPLQDLLSSLNALISTNESN